MSLNRPTLESGRMRTVYVVLGVAIVLVGAGLRVQGAMGELWFDEIWSFNIATGLESWHEAFWRYPKDNNHPLNTWWLYMMGVDRENLAYHLFSVITGTASIVVAGWIAARHHTKYVALRMLAAMILVAVMYPFVNYGSEARGYAPMMLFSLLAFACIENPKATSTHARWGYGLGGILGVLSHLATLPILFALSVCFGVRQLLQGRGLVHTVHATVRLNGPLVAGLLIFVSGLSYGIHLNNNIIEFGGSTLTCAGQNCFLTALGAMIRFMIGGFNIVSPGLLSGFYIMFSIVGVAWLGGIGNRRALPLGLILLGVPLLFFVAGQPAIPHGRYFFAVFAFFPLFIVEIMGELFKRGTVARVLSCLALIALVGVNGWAVRQFLHVGRGNTTSALEFILANFGDGPIRIGTEMTYQLQTVMDFTKRHIAPDRSIEIIKFKNIPTVKPAWLISVTIHTENLPATACTGGLLYTLEKGYGHWGMSGSTWGLYRLSPTPAPNGCVWITKGRE